jgi:3-oxoacyl-[acyl-carrier-protein] synthase-3
MAFIGESRAMKRVYIKTTGAYLPGEKVSNAHVEERIAREGMTLPNGVLASILGSEIRYYASENEQVSDLAVNAVHDLGSAYIPQEIDLLIFAAASADLLEPATANIIQHKLGLQCPVFDMKNACNSVVNAFEVADALLLTGNYRNILITSGEKPSDCIKYKIQSSQELKERFAAFSFGDAGFACILSTTEEEKGFLFHKHRSFGEHWQLSTVLGGGSMFPHNADQNYFGGKTSELRTALEVLAPPFVHQCLKEVGIGVDEIDVVCTHQVSQETYEAIALLLGCNSSKIIQTFKRFGNTASTALPLALHHGIKEGNIKEGVLVLLLGLAAGVNVSVQLLRV